MLVSFPVNECKIFKHQRRGNREIKAASKGSGKEGKSVSYWKKPWWANTEGAYLRNRPFITGIKAWLQFI